MTVVEAAHIAAFALAGFVLGAASFASLKLNTDLYLGGQLWRPIALHLLRLAIVSAALACAALQGAGPLLAAAAGIVIARPVTVRLLGRTR
jgi:F1F0 ATPase subunit 2